MLRSGQICRRLAERSVETFAILKESRYYRNFFYAASVSQIAFWLQNTAESWLVLDLTRSGTMMGLLAICQYAPFAIFGLFAGTAADRIDVRRQFFWAQMGLTICAAMLTLLALADRIDVAAVFAFGVVRSLIYCVSIPASQTFVIGFVGQANASKVIGLGAARAHMARIVGPGLAGVIISHAGIGICFAANAGGHLAMLAAIACIPSQHHSYAVKNTEYVSPIARLREGISYVVRMPHLLIATMALFCITSIPMSFATTLPIFTRQTLEFDSAVFGLLFASLGLGSVAGALTAASWLRTSFDRIFGAAAGLGIMELVLIFERSIVLSVIALVCAGFCMTSFVVSVNSVLFSNVRSELLGRMTVLSNYIMLAIGPLGSSISGWLSEKGGTDLAFGIGGSVAIVVAVTGMLATRVFRVDLQSRGL